MKRNGTSLSCSASSMACGEIGRERSARSQSQPSSARPRRALAALSPRSRRALAAPSPRPRRDLAALSPRSRRHLAGISPASRRALAGISAASRRHLPGRLGGSPSPQGAAPSSRSPAQSSTPTPPPSSGAVHGAHRRGPCRQSRPISANLGWSRASSCELVRARASSGR